MARYEDLPFHRGEAPTEDAFDHLLGREYEIEDYDWAQTSGARKHRSGMLITIRLVKNSSGVAILPKRLVQSVTASGAYGQEVLAFTRLSAQDWLGVSDEFLPAAGAPDGSYFYIVVKGPTVVLTPDDGAAFNGDITAGAVLVAATAAASTGLTAGRVAVQNITGSSTGTDYTDPINNSVNVVGRAISAATTDNTRTEILADVGRI
jgi:hypothetical protein